MAGLYTRIAQRRVRATSSSAMTYHPHEITMHSSRQSVNMRAPGQKPRPPAFAGLRAGRPQADRGYSNRQEIQRVYRRLLARTVK